MNGAPLYTFVLGFLILLIALLWVLIPFAVFGIKPLLREILAELRRGNAAPARPGVLPADNRTLGDIMAGK